MISEHFRIFNAQLVRKSNVLNFRHGSKVHSSFEKFAFESEASMHEEIKKMEALLEFNQQWMSCYFANLGYYDTDGILEKNPILKSAKSFYQGIKSEFSLPKCVVKLLEKVDIVQRLILNTFLKHFGKIPPNFGLSNT